MDNSVIKIKIGQRIRETRQARKMSQADLAFDANISLPHISDIELGKKEMSITTFIRIIEALQVSADEILRSDIPSVNKIYQKEFADLLGDCSANETESIIKIVKELKGILKQNKEVYFD